jgi:hypothetical protein
MPVKPFSSHAIDRDARAQRLGVLPKCVEDGEPIRNLQYPYVRWRRTLTLTLKGRYREPYNARHSSVSWNLMIGKDPLWVAKQHGHSVQTMLETYAAWTEGAKESDIEAIKQAMNTAPRVVARAANSSEVVAVYQVSAAPPIIKVAEAENATNPPASPGICHQFATSEGRERVSV